MNVTHLEINIFLFIAQEKPLKRIFWVASTGGHLNELLSLSSLFDYYDSFILTEKTNSTLVLKDTYKGKVFFFIFGSKVRLIPYLIKFFINTIRSFYYFFQFNPDFIITTGTHTAVPLCFIAHFFKKKVVYIETRASFSDITQTGKIVNKICNLFVIQRVSLLGKIPNATLCECE